MTPPVATSASWAITVVRVTLGTIFFAHGSQKVFGWFGGLHPCSRMEVL